MGLITDPAGVARGVVKVLVLQTGRGFGQTVSTHTLSVSYVHSKSPYYAFTRSSLHLRLKKITAS